MFDLNYNTFSYLALALMVILLVVATVFRNRFLSIFRSFRHTKIKQKGDKA